MYKVTLKHGYHDVDFQFDNLLELTQFMAFALEHQFNEEEVRFEIKLLDEETEEEENVESVPFGE